MVGGIGFLVIDFYGSQVRRYDEGCRGLKK